LKSARYWLLSATWCAVAFAAPPPAAPPARQPEQQQSPSPDVTAATPGAGAPSVGTPDDDFIEFLGADDVEDAAWWEYLKKSAPRRAQQPVPPQDAKQ
jgi:hypothetical protein